jgi:hypothetical protein
MPRVLPVGLITVFSISVLPVQAFPGASVNLVRINGEGIQGLPGVQSSAGGKAPQGLPSDPVMLSQATGRSAEDVTYLLSGSDDFEIRFQDPLPSNLTGYISVRRKVANGTGSGNGEEVERIPFNSPNVSISDDRRVLTIKHNREVRDGESLCALLPEGPYSLPSRLTPCCFAVARPTPTARRTTPCGYVASTPSAFPWWLIPVGLGIGVGICAAAGCFNSSGDGGGGSSSPSSR